MIHKIANNSEDHHQFLEKNDAATQAKPYLNLTVLLMIHLIFVWCVYFWIPIPDDQIHRIAWKESLREAKQKKHRFLYGQFIDKSR